MKARGALEKWLNRIWYQGSRWWLVLWPLSMIFMLAVAARRLAYRQGWRRPSVVNVPVVVVGNITVGGVGKTPLVLHLVRLLMERGVRPGVLMRGYGRQVTSPSPVLVSDISTSALVGDEAMLIYRRTGVSVCVSADRVRGAQRLIGSGVDLILCDDGLQHYALHRDLEIAIVDGERKLGNGRVLPAGPLREPASRLDTVGMLIHHHARCDNLKNCMSLQVSSVISLDQKEHKSLHQLRTKTWHAVAGIGNPARFFATLIQEGLRIIEHPFGDHHRFSRKDFEFEDSGPIIMTEKDAVKCRELNLPDAWYLQVDAVLSHDIAAQLEMHLQQLLGHQTRH